MLQIKNICKEYRTGGLVQKALDDVSLNLRDNEFVAILGPSGSGKTTLLNIIGGLDRYDSGDLIINGISTQKYKDRDWDSYRNHTIGFVFQSYNLIPHQSVLANVELALTISGIGKSERRRRATEALEKVGLGKQLHKRPSQMSGGQKQRVAIAGVIAMEPKCIVLDEPTAMLDPNGRKEVISAVEKLRREKNVTVILITHYMEEVVDADQVFVMDDGRIVMHGTPREIFSRVDELKKYRMDVPQVTMLADELIHRGVDLPKGILRREELVEALCPSTATKDPCGMSMSTPSMALRLPITLPSSSRLSYSNTSFSARIMPMVYRLS